MKNALQLAESEINAAGGVLDRQIRFQLEDQGRSDAEFLSIAKDMIGKHYPGIIGPDQSSYVVAMADDVFAAKQVLISPSASSPTITKLQPAHDRYLFRTVPADDLQGKLLARLLYDGVASTSGPVGGACRKMSIVHIDDTYGNALATVLADAFQAKTGATVATNDAVMESAQASYSDVVKKIVAAVPDCLAIIAFSDTVPLIVRELKAAIATDIGTNPNNAPKWSSLVITGADGAYDSALLKGGLSDPNVPTSDNVVEGMMGTSSDPAPSTPQYADFLANWKVAYTDVPPAYAVNTYDAAILIALAIQKAGTTTDGTKIRDALFEVSKPGGAAQGPGKFRLAAQAIRNGAPITYVGASGPCQFDEYGNVIADYIVWKAVRRQARLEEAAVGGRRRWYGEVKGCRAIVRRAWAAASYPPKRRRITRSSAHSTAGG